MSTAEKSTSPVDEGRRKDVEDLEAGSTQHTLESNINTQNVPADFVKENGGSSDQGSDLLVWWDEPADQDPTNPMNWPDSRKWVTIAVLSSITFLT